MFDVRAFPRVGPLTQRSEQGTRNSRKRFCAYFTALRSVADARCSAFHTIGDCIPILYDVERCLGSTRRSARLEWDGWF